MYIEQMYTNCLSEAAYYIESNGEAAIIDPLRETAPYLEMAKQRGATIKYVFETHFHADFVSGHVDLAKATGATIVYGPTAKTSYEIHEAQDGEQFSIGDISITTLHTPGHTPESTTWLLKDESGKDHAIFSGDTLFIGDVGRPDLAIKSGEITKEDLAGLLYDSLRNKIMPLTDDVLVYPAHGAGSACGKNLSDETFATLGNQKQTNYALQDISREDFVVELTTGIMPAPQYFSKNAMLNKNGYDSIGEVMERGVHALSAEEVKQEQQNGALIIDTRDKDDFVQGFIPGSMFVGLDGSYAVWVGTLVTDIKKRIVVIADTGREEEAVKRLARVGYDNTIGYLDGGIEAWTAAGNALDQVNNITANELEALQQSGTVNVLDARKPGEYDSEHMQDAQSYPLDYIQSHLNDLDKDKTYQVHCKSGYRSLIAVSILKANGYQNLMNVTGGFDAIKETEIPKTAYVCDSLT
jgi:hydroxyacylglutathione hydrolase